MLHLVSPSALPLRYISSGQLINDGGFVHPRRIIDTFVLILGNQGVLHIEQNEVSHCIGANQYILLFPGVLHFGNRPSMGHLSYYWCHFQIRRNNYKLISQEAVNQKLYLAKENNITTNNYIIPETGKLLCEERAIMFFRQLLDAGERKSHSEYLTNYALSLLAMEISTDFVGGYDVGAVSSTYKHMTNIMEWIRVNYPKDPGVAGVAEAFNYNPNYLSHAFKKHVGCSLLDYINRMKISATKKALLSSDEPIKAIALAAGFRDENYFTKAFKKLEGVSPSQYRNTFYRKHMNEK
ncbi:MAG: AraC family transcriptional regulator [Treponema sp.]|nr:AraC family transcriptional regulator [Treponema sp.]